MIPTEKPGTPAELVHYGKKGMRWGVRSETSSLAPGSKRDIRRETNASAALRIGNTKKDFLDSRKDAKFVKKTTKVSSFTLTKKVNSNLIKEASKTMKPEVNQLNKKPQYSSKYAKAIIKKNIYNPNSPDPLVRAYHKELSAIYMKHIEKAAEKQLKMSPSGKWEQYLSRSGDHWTVDIRRTDIKHDAMSNNTRLIFNIKPIYDQDGYIVDFEPFENSISQGEEFVKNFLSHGQG